MDKAPQYTRQGVRDLDAERPRSRREPRGKRPGPRPCPVCRGTGLRPYDQQDCFKCNGTGVADQ